MAVDTNLADGIFGVFTGFMYMRGIYPLAEQDRQYYSRNDPQASCHYRCTDGNESGQLGIVVAPRERVNNGDSDPVCASVPI